jgi:hypothetical protein
MILKIKNRSNLISAFLNPISKISERCIIKIEKDHLSSLVATPDGTLILYTKFDHETESSEDDTVTLNIADLNKIIKILSYIDKDDIELNIQSNSLSYKDDDIQFNYFLLEDGVINAPAVVIDKLKKVDYQSSFTLSRGAMNSINKLAMYASDSEKVYLYTQDGSVVSELNDRKRHNINNASIKVSDTFKGSEIKKPIPIKYENFRVISASQRNDINILINTDLSVLMFQSSDEQSSTAYFMSGLVA